MSIEKKNALYFEDMIRKKNLPLEKNVKYLKVGT